MTEQHFPDEQMGDAVSNLLRAAAQPATAEELQGMAAFVQQFTAEVAAAPVSITSRSHSMRATRITRRATAMVAITLLAAGTAAAAAGGALDSLPGPFHQDSAEVKSESTESTVDEATENDDDTTTSADGITLNAPTFAPELHGLCEAWTNGAAKDATDPAFAKLADAATAAGQTIDEFCVAVQAAHDAEDESDDESADDQGEDESSESESHDAPHTSNSAEDGETDHTSGTAAPESHSGKGSSQDNVTTTSDHSGKEGRKP